MNDSRFAKVHTDPRFMRMKKSDRKTKVESRFKGMFTDKRFSTAPKFDKYGRKVRDTKNQVDPGLKELYTNSDDDDDEDEEEDDQTIAPKAQEEGNSVDDDSDDESGDGDSEEPPDGVGRPGQGAATDPDSESDSASSDEDSIFSNDLSDAVASDEDDEEEEQEAIPTTDATWRVAVMNLDWTNLSAVDIMVVLQSFCPARCVVTKVSIHPSRYGLEQMEKEKMSGPDIFVDEANSGDGDGEGNGAPVDDDKLRAYERQKLKYYFAVVECDSVQAAEAVYNNCDGIEFERSSNYMDLRFIPDDTDIDTEATDVATEVPEDYEPPDFFSRAEQHTKVELSWDKDDPKRGKLKKRLTAEELRNDNMRAFLASSSDEGEEDTAQKYRDLLSVGDGDGDGGDEHGDQDEDSKGNMEVTFSSAFDELGEQLKQSREEKQLRAGETTWETTLREAKEKRRKKREARKQAAEAQAENEDDEDEDGGFFLDDDDNVEGGGREDDQDADGSAPARLAEQEAAEEDRRKAELLDIWGLGEVRMAEYGSGLLKVLDEHRDGLAQTKGGATKQATVPETPPSAPAPAGACQDDSVGPGLSRGVKLEQPDQSRLQLDTAVQEALLDGPLAASPSELASYEMPAFNSLVEWKRARARELGYNDPCIICHNRTLCELVQLLPSDHTELLACWGVGPKRVELHGDLMLAALRPWRDQLCAARARDGSSFKPEQSDDGDAHDEEDGTEPCGPTLTYCKAASLGLTGTKTTTLRMLQQGMDVHEVSEVRGHKLDTVLNYAADCVDACPDAFGTQSMWDKLGIGTKVLREVSEAIAELGKEAGEVKLREMKRALPRHGFGQLRLALKRLRMPVQVTDAESDQSGTTTAARSAEGQNSQDDSAATVKTEDEESSSTSDNIWSTLKATWATVARTRCSLRKSEHTNA